jgi:hypothetical protein
MFMKRLLAFFAISISILTVACSKHTSGPNAGHGPNALFPLVEGDTWYYKDSVFNNAGQYGTYPDTAVVTNQAQQDPYTGYTFLGIQEDSGWFSGSYIAVDPNNSTIWEADPPSFQSYPFFQAVSQDGPVSNGTDYSNPGCPINYVQYGYASPFTVAGYSCLKNAEVVTDCNNVIQEEVISYVSPGVGVVRIEDYLADSTQNNKLYQDYSQTLTGTALKKQ